jgi:CDP-6-deoxy-D-xylo-4-hexulose-3-dehydrase
VSILNIDELIDQLANLAMTTLHGEAPFIPGESAIPVTGKVFGSNEIAGALKAVVEFWLTAGPHTESFEKHLRTEIGMRHALMVNSGSSANLLAVSALTSRRLGDRRLRAGDEVLTVAAGFPTTVAPVIQNGLVPVFVDVDLGTYVAPPDLLESAISPRTKAIVMAHTLGNPFDLDAVIALAKKHDLWLIEDNCDGLGGTYKGKKLGSFGDLSTLSFYPAHHITTGEGGAVLIKNAALKPLVESFRDWGRDCWCAPGKDDTCSKRYKWKLGDLPEGYDHKYTYSHLGYNLKSGDIQAAIGLAQLERLPHFIELRRKNWKYLRDLLSDLEELFVLPRATDGSDPSWFGFAITVRPGNNISRDELVQFLNTRQIGTRLLFGGNLVRQPAFQDAPTRLGSSLTNTDLILENTFWVGVWPGLQQSQIDYIAESIHLFVRQARH